MAYQLRGRNPSVSFADHDSDDERPPKQRKEKDDEYQIATRLKWSAHQVCPQVNSGFIVNVLGPSVGSSADMTIMNASDVP